MYRDHFDGSVWQETSCKDPIVAENGGPAMNVGPEFCADGVNPFHRGSYSMWFGALSILNLLLAARHSVDTMHLCFIVPGPDKPVCPNTLYSPLCCTYIEMPAIVTDVSI